MLEAIERMSPRDALYAGWLLAHIRVIAYRKHVVKGVTGDPQWIESLAKLVPIASSLPSPTNTTADAYHRSVVAEATKGVNPGSLAECGLAVGNALVELFLASASLRHWDSAQESFIATLDRFALAVRNDEVDAPAVNTATSAVRDLVFAHPLFIDRNDAERSTKRAAQWLEQLDKRLRELFLALALPATRPVVAPASSHEQALLAEIVAHPEDLSLRARWAAFAIERGDHRGRFVVEELALRELRRRESYAESPIAEHLQRNHPEWRAELTALGAADCVYSAGFIEGITIEASTFLANGRAIFETTPLRFARLLGAAPIFDDLMASGLLARLLWIDLRGQGLRDGHVEKLVGLGQLRALSLEGNAITDEGVAMVWKALEDLRYCGLHGNPCAPVIEVGMTPEYASHAEFILTARGAELTKAYGARMWPYRDAITLDELA
jgi:hypothetical protein